MCGLMLLSRRSSAQKRSCSTEMSRTSWADTTALGGSHRPAAQAVSVGVEWEGEVM
jgi:hypothetical protein